MEKGVIPDQGYGRIWISHWQRGRPQSARPTMRSQKRKAVADAAPSTAAQPNSVAGTPLRIPYGNKDVAMKLGARYGSAGWYAPPGVDLSAFGERGWL
jgi:DNA topoisomerase III